MNVFFLLFDVQQGHALISGLCSLWLFGVEAMFNMKGGDVSHVMHVLMGLRQHWLLRAPAVKCGGVFRNVW